MQFPLIVTKNEKKNLEKNFIEVRVLLKTTSLYYYVAYLSGGDVLGTKSPNPIFVKEIIQK